MHIRYGYRIEIDCAADTRVLTLLDIHSARRRDITAPDQMKAVALATGDAVDTGDVRIDAFGNIRRSLTAPAGGARLECEGILFDSGFAEERPWGDTPPVSGVPTPETAKFLSASRLCDVEPVAARAAAIAGAPDGGPGAVEAVCAYVRDHVRLESPSGVGARTSSQILSAGRGDARELALVAISLCRAAGVPARFCFGYVLNDQPAGQGSAPVFNSWFEAHLGGAWWPFDPVSPSPRIGRILIGVGRDSADAEPLKAQGASLTATPPFSVRILAITADEVTGSRFPVSAAERREHHTMRLSLARD